MSVVVMKSDLRSCSKNPETSSLTQAVDSPFARSDIILMRDCGVKSSGSVMLLSMLSIYSSGLLMLTVLRVIRLFPMRMNHRLRSLPEPDNPEDLYWVFVFLSEPHPTFFVMRSDEVSRKWHERNDKYPPGTAYCGLNWGIVKQYQDQWDALP